MHAVSTAWQWFPGWVRYPSKTVARTARLYYEDECGTYAAAIAYHALFSLVPLALILLSVLGLVVDSDRIVNFIYDQVPLQESDQVQTNVDQIVSQAQQLSVAGLSFGIVALAWTGTGIFSAVRRGLNATYSARMGKPYLRGKLIDFGLVIAFGFLVLVSVAATASVQFAFSNFGPGGNDGVIGIRIGTTAATAAVTLVLFTMLYRFVPTTRPKWMEAIPGAIFATILFEALKNIAAFLLSQAPFTTNTAIYAGFSTAFAFLFWMYLNASILLLGAEFGRAIRQIRLEARLERARHPVSVAARFSRRG